MKVDRVDPVETAKRVRVDDYYIDSCAFCGDELDDNEECARRCYSSRVDRMDAR